MEAKTKAISRIWKWRELERSMSRTYAGPIEKRSSPREGISISTSISLLRRVPNNREEFSEITTLATR